MCSSEHSSADLVVDIDESILLVVGAHPQAELCDRPQVERLRQRMLDWQELQCELIFPMRVLICTDLWYLNDAAMMSRPTVSIGRPGLNAATAYLANCLPASFAVADLVHMHFDPEFIEQTACIWGRNEDATATACDLFVDRYLTAFMHSVHLLPTPEE
jgi:hypothetical protein